jgi:DNA-binding transcriptional regulator PaaX
MTTHRTKPLTKSLLLLLAGMGDAAIEFEALWSALLNGYGHAYARGGAGYVAELKNIRSEHQLKGKVRELARRRYVKLGHTNGRFVLALTNKGFTATLADRMRQVKLQPHGWYTVVVFDIPEDQSTSRKLLRLVLRQGGFRQLQRSVWVSRGDNRAIVAAFVRQSKVQRWVNVYRATDFLIEPSCE